MIFCTNNIYAKVWKVTPTEKYLDLRISTSEKTLKDQETVYINSNWFARAIGHAFNSLKSSLKDGDRILITKCKLTNETYESKDGTKKSAFHFLILEASIEQPTGSATASPAPESAATTPATATETDNAGSTDDLPW